jgi:hypothetical protein
MPKLGLESILHCLKSFNRNCGESFSSIWGKKIRNRLNLKNAVKNAIVRE